MAGSETMVCSFWMNGLMPSSCEVTAAVMDMATPSTDSSKETSTPADTYASLHPYCTAALLHRCLRPVTTGSFPFFKFKWRVKTSFILCRSCQRIASLVLVVTVGRNKLTTT